MPTTGHAEPHCPWLNAATAGGLLGGDVVMTVSARMEHVPGQGSHVAQDQVRMDRFDTTCEFTRKAGHESSSLRIVVTTMADPAKEYAAMLAKCGGTVALKGIGNEAVQCRNKNMAEEQVIARVRDRAFVLTVHRPPAPEGGDALRADTENIAEQVAGSIF
jgi:hypothetical protein